MRLLTVSVRLCKRFESVSFADSLINASMSGISAKKYDCKIGSRIANNPFSKSEAAADTSGARRVRKSDSLKDPRSVTMLM